MLLHPSFCVSQTVLCCACPLASCPATCPPTAAGGRWWGCCCRPGGAEKGSRCCWQSVGMAPSAHMTCAAGQSWRTQNLMQMMSFCQVSPVQEGAHCMVLQAICKGCGSHTVGGVLLCSLYRACCSVHGVQCLQVSSGCVWQLTGLPPSCLSDTTSWPAVCCCCLQLLWSSKERRSSVAARAACWQFGLGATGTIAVIASQVTQNRWMPHCQV